MSVTLNGRRNAMLTLCMITKDEANNIQACLDSVKDIVNEIIVVDTGSTDNTVELCLNAGARVFHFPWNGSFSDARNFGLEHCKTDWVLVLDADEELDPDTSWGIPIAMDDKDKDSYYIVIRNYVSSDDAIVGGKHAMPSEHKFGPYYVEQPSIRLFRNGIKYEGCIHETVDRAVKSSDKLGVLIHHKGKMDIEREQSKSISYLQLAIKEVNEHPKDHMAWCNLMQQAAIIYDWKTVLLSAATARDLMCGEHNSVLLYGSKACMELGAHKMALEWSTKLVELYPEDIAGLNIHAINLFNVGDMDAADGAFKKAIATGHAPNIRSYAKFLRICGRDIEAAMVEIRLLCGILK